MEFVECKCCGTKTLEENSYDRKCLKCLDKEYFEATFAGCKIIGDIKENCYDRNNEN